jgi:DNA processing protein
LQFLRFSISPYIKGNLRSADGAVLSGTLQPETDRVAMVGSRKFTPYGEGIALEFGERLAAAGLTIASGAARGIDTSAHKGALKSGRTVAVLGCGVDVVYPSENRRLLQEIASSGGAVLSEYGPGTQPLPAFFPCPQPHHQWFVAGDAGGGGGTALWVAYHG